MGVWLTIACYLITFSPSLALFCRFVAKDPLRIILFVLGAFFWLASLLLCSFIWLALSMVWDALPLAVIVSIALQDAARIFYFWILKKAQRGLNKITRPGASTIAPGVSDLHNARHMLALVCGLGMGVMAALFLTMNVFAEFSGPGTIGLPRAMKENKRDVNYAGPYLPLYYALTGCLASLFGVVWTILPAGGMKEARIIGTLNLFFIKDMWDSCHKIGQRRLWFLPGVVATVSHLIVSGLSWFNSEGYQPFVLSGQFVVLLGCVVYSQLIMGATASTILGGVSAAFVDWFTLKWMRQKLFKTEEPLARAEEIEADERGPVDT